MRKYCRVQVYAITLLSWKGREWYYSVIEYDINGAAEFSSEWKTEHGIVIPNRKATRLRNIISGQCNNLMERGPAIIPRYV